MSLHYILIITLLALTFAIGNASAQAFHDYDDTSAAIFAYSYFGDDTLTGASISKEQFESHINELISGDYNVIDMPDLIQAFENHKTLLPRTVTLTFDNAHISFLDYAFPLLKEHNLPFTLFISADNASSNNPQYLNWDQLRTLQKSKLASFGLHGTTYSHIYQDEAEDQRRQINSAIAQFQENLDEKPLFFAYPYGEISETLQKTIKNAGFIAAFGQNSSISYYESAIFTLPRFIMSDIYADLERFRMIANALPLPVSSITPNLSVIDQNPPILGFTLDPSLIDYKDKLSCFDSTDTKSHMEFITDNRIEVRFDQPFEHNRIRINCTMATDKTYGEDQLPIWRWFGMLYHY